MKLRTMALLGLCTAMSYSVAEEANDTITEDVNELSTVSVSASKNNGPEITTDKLLKVPGAGGDPLKAIEALPGVVLGGFGPFAIPAVRGSNPFDNIYITDFLPVGYVFHNDGNSTYNDNLIENFALKAGAWDAQYNNAMGAVLATKLRDPYIEPTTTTIDLSLLRAGALVEGAISDDSAFYASYRQSLLEFYVENFIDEDELTFTEVPKNSDYQLKYLWQPSSTSNLRLVATGAQDSVGLEFGPENKAQETEPGLEGGIDADTYYHNQGIIYDALLKGGVSTIMSLSRKEEDASFSIGSLFNLDAVNYEYRFKNYYNVPLDNGDTFRLGIDLSSTEIDYRAGGLYTPCNEDTGDQCPPFSVGIPFDNEDTLTINGRYAFVAYDWMVTPNWDLTLGLGNSYNDFSEENNFEPRIESRYKLTEDTTLTAAYGQHGQFIREFRFIADEIGNPELDFPTSDHYVLGFEHQFDDSLSAKVELYYKDIQNLVIANPELTELSPEDQEAFVNGTLDNPPAPYINGSTGQAYGLELLINKNLTDKWFGWLSVAYSKTKRKNDISGVEIDYGYDRPWVVNLVAAYQKNENTSYGFKWRYQSGNLVTPVVLGGNHVAYYECTSPGESNLYLSDTSQAPAAYTCVTEAPQNVYVYDPEEGAPNSERLPAYHRLDFRLDHKTSKRSSVYFEVINLYNRLNVSDYEYNKEYTEREEVESLPIIFSFGAKMVFE